MQEAIATWADMPAWVTQIRDSYMSANASVFIIHGVRDRFPYSGRYLQLPEFLEHAFCADKKVVVYDISRGMHFPQPETQREFDAFLQVYRRQSGGRPTDEEIIKPAVALPLLQEFLFSRNGVALIVDYLDKIAPREEARFMSFDERRLVTMLRQLGDDPRLLRRNSFVFLIAGSLADVSEELYTRASRTEAVEIPMPEKDDRARYVEFELGTLGDSRPELAMTPAVLAEITNGLSLTQVGSLLRGAMRQQRQVTFELVAEWKRRAIETEIGDLVEFTMPRMGLEALAGVDKQKEILLRTADALRSGKTAVVPKGILLTGPPGCGKTFCMECFAHDCGIPFVQLKNVFSKYVGATESNLEKLFHYLEALSPVFVFIDEFDQSYGRRVTSDSDSGVSRRVFAMFNAFLSDERHQGKILFGAATNRPDLIDPSTLRAGRFDLKLPFLLPDREAREAILEVTIRTLRVAHCVEDLGAPADQTAGYSGADLKEVVRIAQRKAVFDGRESVSPDDLTFAVGDYIPPTTSNADQIRLMELLSVLSCTSRSLLPEAYVGALESGILHRELEELRLRMGI